MLIGYKGSDPSCLECDYDLAIPVQHLAFSRFVTSTAIYIYHFGEKAARDLFTTVLQSTLTAGVIYEVCSFSCRTDFQRAREW